MQAQSKSPLENRRLLRDNADIRALLEKLQRRRSRIAAYYGNKNNSFSTYLLEVSDQGVIMHNPCEPAVVERIISSGSLLFNSICSTAPVNFVAVKIESCDFEGQAAFRISVPTSIHWIQRRQTTRLRAHQLKDAICEITFKNGQIARNPLSDISLGGLSVVSDEFTAYVAAGTELDECNIILPNMTRFKSPIRICSATNTTLENGDSATRYGCQFLNLNDYDRLVLQEFIEERC